MLDSVKAWYKLGWNAKEHTLQIHIAKTFVASQRPIPKDSPAVAEAGKSFHDTLFTSFCGDLSRQYFGFNQRIRRMDNSPASNEFVSFSVCLPHILIETGMVCQECQGTLKRDRGLECFYAKVREKISATTGTLRLKLPPISGFCFYTSVSLLNRKCLL